MGGPTHEYGPIWVRLHWDEHPCALHAWGNKCVASKEAANWPRHKVYFWKSHRRSSTHVPVHFLLCSCISNNPVASYPATRGTGRRVTKAVTASQTKWGVSPTLTPEISPGHTLSPPQFPVPVLFLLPLQPTPVPASVRRGLHRRLTPNGAIVDLPQVPFFSLWSWGYILVSEKPVSCLNKDREERSAKKEIFYCKVIYYIKKKKTWLM